LKLRIASLTLLLLALVAIPAMADNIYDNGPINGTTDGWTINFGFVVSDTFNVSGAGATITGLNFGAWLFVGDTLVSAEVSITSDPFGGTSYFDGTVQFSQGNCVGNQYGFNVCTETSASFNGLALQPGTYWVTLQNAVVNTGDPVYWDENSGIGCHSPGCPSEVSENSEGTIPPESFDVTGSYGGGTTPEPSDIWLFGSGLLGLAAVLRRKLWQ